LYAFSAKADRACIIYKKDKIKRMVKNKSKVYIDSKEVLAGATFHVSISQSMGTHNTFTISFPTSAQEGFSASLMDGSIPYIGKKISISYRDGLEFVGLISHIQLQKKDAASGTVLIHGSSADVLLSKRYDCMSFDQGYTLQDVISEAITDHKNDALTIQYGHQMGTTLPYTVQYNESDYDFVHRICSKYGKWLYNNGKELCIGRIGEKIVKGVYGDQIRTFGLQGGIQEQSFSINQHDWVNNSPLEDYSSSASPAGKHPYLQTVKQNSDALYNVAGYYHYVHGAPEYSNQQGINEATKAHTLARTANMLVASGTSTLYRLRIGDTLKIESFSFMDLAKKEAYGSYLITQIRHEFSSSGEYTNSFEGVPEGTEYPNYSNPFTYPRIETQRATVKDNNDPEGLGRIKVQFPWQKKDGDRTTPWIKMATPYAGADKGFYFIPEIDEEVLIGFEGANAERPFVLSAGFNKTAKSSYASEKNDIKAIHTRSGHIIKLDDTNGEESITITDKNGNKILLNTKDSSIHIHAPANMTFTADTIDIKAKNALTMSSAESTIAIKAKQDIGMHSEEAEMQLSAKQNVDMRSTEAAVKVKAKTKTNIVGDEIVDVLAGNKLLMHGKSTSKLTGGEVHVNKK